ncbi:MAG: YfhO family protein [Oscillospiraceae bacterium]|nr:YfhO family protein [Oscillospiraceae bacterium]
MLFTSQDNTHNWASISLYLPLFTITGVVVFLKKNPKSWVTYFLKVCLIIALVPGLNSMFSLFNSSYYARWYYMPILIMCLATSKALELDYDLKFGIKIEIVALFILTGIFCLPNKVIKESERLSVALGKKENIETEIKWFKFSDVPVLFWQCIAFSIVFMLIVFVYDHERKKSGILKKISIVLVVINIINFIIFINSTIAETIFDSEKVYDSFIAYEPQLNDNSVYRIAHASSNSNVNYGMIWGYMNAGCFNSVEANEINDFYYNIKGEKRNMMSRYESEDYPAYSLLSVKYIFNLSTGDDLNVEINPVKMAGCSLYDKQQCYYIYKNDCYIPFGFMYDYCIDDKTLEEYLDENVTENKYQYKKFAMLRALVLYDDDIEQYKDYIKLLPPSMLENLDEESYYSDCENRRAKSCSSFEYDSKGYCAQITAARKGIVFFSVPCSDGWTVKVNGIETEIIKAHYGLSAVAVEPGENKIEFAYETPGIAEGKMITFVSATVLIIYSVLVIIQRRRRRVVRKSGEKVDG